MLNVEAYPTRSRQECRSHIEAEVAGKRDHRNEASGAGRG
jgi:hypothetical protein